MALTKAKVEDSTKHPIAECTFDGAVLVCDDGRYEMRVHLPSLSEASSQAIIAAGDSASEVHSIKDWKPGEKLIAEGYVCVRGASGEAYGVQTGEIVDEYSIIEQILRADGRPVKLYRYGLKHKVESMVREHLAAKTNASYAISKLIQRRAIEAGG